MWIWVGYARTRLIESHADMPFAEMGIAPSTYWNRREESTVAHDVIELILQDHRELERLFDLLVTQPDTRPTLVPVMTALLTAHSRAEEAEVYPAAREAGGEADVEHSQREHLEADILAEKV